MSSTDQHGQSPLENPQSIAMDEKNEDRPPETSAHPGCAALPQSAGHAATGDQVAADRHPQPPDSPDLQSPDEDSSPENKGHSFRTGLKKVVACPYYVFFAMPVLLCALMCGMDYNNGHFPEDSMGKKLERSVKLEKLRGKKQTRN